MKLIYNCINCGKIIVDEKDIKIKIIKKGTQFRERNINLKEEERITTKKITHKIFICYCGREYKISGDSKFMWSKKK